MCFNCCDQKSVQMVLAFKKLSNSDLISALHWCNKVQAQVSRHVIIEKTSTASVEIAWCHSASTAHSVCLDPYWSIFTFATDLEFINLTNPIVLEKGPDTDVSSDTILIENIGFPTFNRGAPHTRVFVSIYFCFVYLCLSFFNLPTCLFLLLSLWGWVWWQSTG